MPRAPSRSSTSSSNASMMRRSSPRPQPGVVELGGEELVERQPERGEVARVLELGDHAHESTLLVGGRVDELEQVAQADDRVPVVEARARLPQGAEPLARTQRRELRPGEVLGEPAGERRAVDLARRALRSRTRAAPRHPSCPRSRSRGAAPARRRAWRRCRAPPRRRRARRPARRPNGCARDDSRTHRDGRSRGGARRNRAAWAPA